jgi:plastocyanin
VVTFSGRVPLLGEQKRDTDPVCARTPMREDEVLVSNGRLKNVIVRVLGAPALPPPASPLVLDQSRCLYTPRVATATVGQVVEVRNSDPTFHNVHGYVGTSTLFNVPQVPSTPHLTKVFQEDGTLVRFRCDVHQWMTAVVWVQKNPFATVTDERGEARLGELPAGRFEVEAWHERYGAKRAPLVIEAGRTAEVSFDFTGKETAPAD